MIFGDCGGLLESDSKRSPSTCDDREGSGGVRLNWMGLLPVSGRWGERVVGVEPILYFCAVVSECVLGLGGFPGRAHGFSSPGAGWMRMSLLAATVHTIQLERSADSEPIATVGGEPELTVAHVLAEEVD